MKFNTYEIFDIADAVLIFIQANEEALPEALRNKFKRSYVPSKGFMPSHASKRSKELLRAFKEMPGLVPLAAAFVIGEAYV